MIILKKGGLVEEVIQYKLKKSRRSGKPFDWIYFIIVLLPIIIFREDFMNSNNKLYLGLYISIFIIWIIRLLKTGGIPIIRELIPVIVDEDFITIRTPLIHFFNKKIGWNDVNEINLLNDTMLNQYIDVKYQEKGKIKIIEFDVSSAENDISLIKFFRKNAKRNNIPFEDKTKGPY